jgi:hypothetical protein
MLTFSTDFLVSILIVGKISPSIFSSDTEEFHKNNEICEFHYFLNTAYCFTNEWDESAYYVSHSFQKASVEKLGEVCKEMDTPVYHVERLPLSSPWE